MLAPLRDELRGPCRRARAHDDLGIALVDLLHGNHRRDAREILEEVARAADLERLVHEVAARDGGEGTVPDLEERAQPAFSRVLASKLRELALVGRDDGFD